MLIDYFPVLFQIIVAVGFAGVSLVLSVVLGQSGRRTVEKDTAYECGKDPIGPTTARFSVKFYMIAMLFILFDIETVFFFLWAVVYKHQLTVDGLRILYAMLFFIAILLVGFAYELKKKALDWVH
jgi:NADH-quinone oxidoreductase subunit A